MKTRILLFAAFALSGISARAQAFDTLQVIVHVIHNGEAVGTGRNISQAQAYSQFDVLNEDFRAQNADIANVPAAFTSFIGDMGLNFARALTDPNGNALAEPGIDRIDRNMMGWSTPPYSMAYIDGTIKPQSIWDPTKYLNIWVLDMGTTGVLSYPTFPSCNSLPCGITTVPDTLRDGIVVTHKAFGRTGLLVAPYDKGRSATYAIAQWLGLLSLAQTSPTGNCGDDCVADTPIDDYFSIYGCPAYPATTSCSASPDGAMYMNFMSYVDDACKVMFTQGQKARIDTVLSCGYFQSSLRLSQVPMALKEQEASMLHIYPNPTSGEITLGVPGNEKGRLEVYSLLGQKVFETKAEPIQTVIFPQALPNGIYLFFLRSADQLYTGRVLLSR